MIRLSPFCKTSKRFSFFLFLSHSSHSFGRGSFGCLLSKWSRICFAFSSAPWNTSSVRTDWVFPSLISPSSSRPASSRFSPARASSRFLAPFLLLLLLFLFFSRRLCRTPEAPTAVDRERLLLFCALYKIMVVRYFSRVFPHKKIRDELRPIGSLRGVSRAFRRRRRRRRERVILTLIKMGKPKSSPSSSRKAKQQQHGTTTTTTTTTKRFARKVEDVLKKQQQQQCARAPSNGVVDDDDDEDDDEQRTRPLPEEEEEG